MCSYPLKSINELLNYKLLLKSYNKSRFSLNKCKNDLHSSKFIVCHDLKGGYLQDSFRFGCQNSDAYRFWNWSQIDIFIYFSHNFITIPPTGWVETAHKNECQILGTIITESEEGKLICDEMLKSQETIESIVDALVGVSQFLDLDGWLLNIENEIDKDVIDKLNLFICKLTSKMHTVKENSLVIWYDSVTKDGELKWQNELNEQNKIFFNACDGIYLNYGWSEDTLIKSKKEAGSRNLDVYAGLDVFGRGCIGGFESIQSIEKIINMELSVAIFAQSWTFECFEKSEYILNETKFWNILEPFKSTREMISFPFRTYFCQGAGNFYKINGETVINSSWYNIGLQEIQPIYQTNYISVCLTDAFMSGSCISIKSSNKGNISLFNSNMFIKEDFHLNIVYKFLSKPFNCSILLTYKENNKDKSFSFSLFNSIDLMREENLHHKQSKRHKKNVSYEYDENHMGNGWTSRAIYFSGVVDFNLTQISIYINEENNSDLLLGNFEIQDSKYTLMKMDTVEFQIEHNLNELQLNICSSKDNQLLGELVSKLSISWISNEEIQDLLGADNMPKELIDNSKDILPTQPNKKSNEKINTQNVATDETISQIPILICHNIPENSMYIENLKMKVDPTKMEENCLSLDIENELGTSNQLTYIEPTLINRKYVCIKPNKESQLFFEPHKSIINRFHIYIWTENKWKFFNFSPIPYFFFKWTPDDSNVMSIKLEILFN